VGSSTNSAHKADRTPDWTFAVSLWNFFVGVFFVYFAEERRLLKTEAKMTAAM